MSEVNRNKWLTNQILDLFEKYNQVVDLKDAVLGKKSTGELRYKKSPKLTPSLKLLLLAISKYEICSMGLKKLGMITSSSRTNVLNSLKILHQNKLIKITNRKNPLGGSFTNFYEIDMANLEALFAKKIVHQGHQDSVHEAPGTVSQEHQGSVHIPTVVVHQEHPNKQVLLNKSIKQKEREPISENKKFSLPDFIDEKDWSDFLEHRKALKAPLSKSAQVRAFEELKKLKEQGQNISDLINQSIVNGWKGFVPIRDNSKQGKVYGSKGSGALFESCKGSLKGTIYDPDFEPPF